MFYMELGGILGAREMTAPFELSSRLFVCLFLSQWANLELQKS